MRYFILAALLLSSCGTTTQDAGSAELREATPFVPSDAKSGWTTALVSSTIQCQGNDGIVGNFCSCLIKSVTENYTPEEAAQAKADAQKIASGTGSSTLATSQISSLSQNCLQFAISTGSATSALGFSAFHRSYQFADSNCTTGVFTFGTPTAFCLNLKNDSRNNSCALAARKQVYGSLCSGTF